MTALLISFANLIATPRMAVYMEYSTIIYHTYLRYIAPEDIHVYSIDEVFLDVTQYLGTYRMTARELAAKRNIPHGEKPHFRQTLLITASHPPEVRKRPVIP